MELGLGSAEVASFNASVEENKVTIFKMEKARTDLMLELKYRNESAIERTQSKSI